MSNDIIFAEQLTFSPSGQRLAYVVVSGGGQYAKWNTKRARRRAVVDGNEGKEYDVERLHDLRFSDDSLHVAYVVHDIKTAAGDKAVVVVDQLEGKSYDDVFCESVSFSADGKKLTYVAREGQKILRVTQAY